MGITDPPHPEEPPRWFPPSRHALRLPATQAAPPKKLLDEHTALLAELAPHAKPGETALETLRRIIERSLR